MEIIILFYLSTAFGFDKEISQKLEWENTRLADGVSDVVVIGLVSSPLIYSGVKGKWDKTAISIGLIGMNHLFTGYLKGIFKRERPNGEDFRSMPSGHSSDAFTSASLLCVLSKDPLICTSGFLLAGTVGYLRIAARKHYFSDVLVGAGLGLINGQVIPTVIFRW